MQTEKDLERLERQWETSGGRDWDKEEECGGEEVAEVCFDDETEN